MKKILVVGITKIERRLIIQSEFHHWKGMIVFLDFFKYILL